MPDVTAKNTSHPHHPTVREFRLEWQGKYIVNNGTLGYNMPVVGGRNQAQCVSTIGQWLLEHGIDQVSGDAIDLDYSHIAKKVMNGPHNYPKAGSAVVFLGGDYDSTYGHIGMSLHGCDQYRLDCLWQNDPDYAPVDAVRGLSYNNVQWWWEFHFLAHTG